MVIDNVVLIIVDRTRNPPPQKSDKVRRGGGNIHGVTHQWGDIFTGGSNILTCDRLPWCFVPLWFLWCVFWSFSLLRLHVLWNDVLHSLELNVLLYVTVQALLNFTFCFRRRMGTVLTTAILYLGSILPPFFLALSFLLFCLSLCNAFPVVPCNCHALRFSKTLTFLTFALWLMKLF